MRKKSPPGKILTPGKSKDILPLILSDLPFILYPGSILLCYLHTELWFKLYFNNFHFPDKPRLLLSTAFPWKFLYKYKQQNQKLKYLQLSQLSFSAMHKKRIFQH